VFGALFDWLLGSFALKMIGVETINTLQYIALFQIFSPRYEPTVTAMKGMTSSLGGFQNKITTNRIVYSEMYEERLNYSASYRGNN
jgi:hypothetical protein